MSIIHLANHHVRFLPYSTSVSLSLKGS